MQQNRSMTEKQQYWQKHLESCKRSGQSRKDYCDQHGLAIDHMSYYASYLKRKGVGTTSSSNFVKVTSISTPQNLTIRLSSGIAIEFPAAALSEVIKSLREID